MFAIDINSLAKGSILLLFMSYILTVNDLKKIKYDDKTLLISL
jgi:hypothetical protein